MPTPTPRSARSKSMPPESSDSADLRRILLDLRRETAAATARQEEFFKQVLLKQEDLFAEICRVSKFPVKGVTVDKNIASQIASVGNAGTKDVPANSEIHPQVTDNQNGELRLHLGKDVQEQDPKEEFLNKQEPFDPTSSAVAETPSKSPTEGSARTSKTRLSFEHNVVEDHDDQSCLAPLRRVLRKRYFELWMAFALICNCFVMCWEAQYQGLEVGFNLQYPGRPQPADMVWSGAETAFLVLDWFFGMLFLLECIVKLVCFRSTYFYDSWNVLDFLCVDAFLVGKYIGAGGAFKPHMLRLLRLFRLARLVRLIRFLEHLEALYVMTTAIFGMKKVLGWAIFLLTLMLLTCDLALVQLLQATYFSEVSVSDLTETQLKKHHEMYAYFGTCTRCMLSMFEITLGNWPPIARLLSEEVSEWFTLLCLIHKLTIGFAVVGVITGVILQETFKVAQTDDIIMLRQRKRASAVLHSKLRHLFTSLDKSEDETVQYEEFERICSDPNIKIWLASLDIETDDLPLLFHLVDVDRDGAIYLEELLTRMPRIRGAARSIDVLSLHEKLFHL